MKPLRSHVFVLGLGLALGVPSYASADLIFDASLGGVSGSGLGAVATVLTIESPGSTSTESGSVFRSSGADATSNTGAFAGGADVNFGNVQTGSNQTQTQTLGDVSIVAANQIAIVLNSSEPSGDSITLTGLRLSIFDGDSDIFNASLAASVTFPTTFTGTGNQGEVFRLDSSEAGSLQTMLDGLTSTQIAALRVGLSASAADATGGHETFNLSKIDIAPAPEPATVFLFGSSLAGIGVLARRKSKGSRSW